MPWSITLPAVVATLLLFPVASASAGTVAVTGPDDAASSVELASLNGREDVIERSYVVRRADGAGRRTVTGYSLAMVLDAAGVDPVHVGYVEISRPGGGAPLLLSRRQATSAGDEPVVVYEDAEGLHVLRSSAADGDLNGADEVVAADGRVAVRVRPGTLLDVSIDVSDIRVPVGGLVRFEAVLGREAAGEPLTISWYFDDGRSAKGRRVSHRFSRRGSYDVTVGVTAPGDAVGASAVATVEVGTVGARGPDRKGGGTNDAADAPDSGVADGASGGGQAGGGGTPAGAGAAPGESPRTMGGARRSPRRSASRRRSAARRVAPRQVAPRRASRPAAPVGERVAGELLSADVEADLITPPRVVAARTGRPHDDGGGFSVPATVWYLAALGALFTLGWTSDMRRSP